MGEMKRVLLVPALLALAAACGGARSLAQTPAPEATVAIVRATIAPTRTATPRPQLCLLTPAVGLPPSYVPPDLVTLPLEWVAGQAVQLRREAAEALVKLLAAAREEGYPMVAVSGYRSYEYQAQVLQQEIRQYGEAQARRQVAEPGHSEHQLGVAVDLATARRPYDLSEDFGTTPEGRWLQQNAARFGFVISYPAGKEAITGYIYEPWHIRYVGPEIARRVVESGQTLTEFLPANGMAGCPPTT
jgi:D-alanyl-D-alanine carboxypeptidase